MDYGDHDTDKGTAGYLLGDAGSGCTRREDLGGAIVWPCIVSVWELCYGTVLVRLVGTDPETGSQG